MIPGRFILLGPIGRRTDELMRYLDSCKVNYHYAGPDGDDLTGVCMITPGGRIRGEQMIKGMFEPVSLDNRVA